MSWFSELLSGGSGAKRRALGRLASQNVDAFRDLGEDYMTQFSTVMQDFTKYRNENVAAFRSDMERSRSDYMKYFEQARTQYGEGMDKAISEMRIGRESTIALSRQENERQQQRARAANAFTGLGQSSFGQQRLEAVGRQGVLQEGLIREQYASQLSSLEAQRASGMSTLSGQYAQGLSAIGSQIATGSSAMTQQYNMASTAANQQAIANQFAMYQHGYNLAANFRGQAAQMAGNAFNPFGQIIGAVAGGFGGTVGSNLGNAFVPPTQ
jgi:hypothetical protein